MLHHATLQNKNKSSHGFTTLPPPSTVISPSKANPFSRQNQSPTFCNRDQNIQAPQSIKDRTPLLRGLMDCVNNAHFHAFTWWLKSFYAKLFQLGLQRMIKTWLGFIAVVTSWMLLLLLVRLIRDYLQFEGNTSRCRDGMCNQVSMSRPASGSPKCLPASCSWAVAGLTTRTPWKLVGHTREMSTNQFANPHQQRLPFFFSLTAERGAYVYGASMHRS